MRSLIQTLFAGVLAAVLVSACSAQSGESAGPASTAAPPASAPEASQRSTAPSASDPASDGGGQANTACSGDDVAAALRAAAQAVESADSYRVSGTTSAGGTEQEYILEFAQPDSVHVVSGPIEYVAIGSQTWQKAGASWEEAPGVDLSTLTAGMGQLNEEILTDATFTDTTVDADSEVDGQPAILLRYHESIPSELEADSEMWLDPATCRPIKNVATSSSQGSSVEFEATYSDWGAVTIEPPA